MTAKRLPVYPYIKEYDKIIIFDKVINEKSSLSSKFSGIDAQFIAIKGFLLLFPCACIALAISSFPVPLSPVIKTVELDLANFFILFFTLHIASEFPTYKNTLQRHNYPV